MPVPTPGCFASPTRSLACLADDFIEASVPDHRHRSGQTILTINIRRLFNNRKGAKVLAVVTCPRNLIGARANDINDLSLDILSSPCGCQPIRSKIISFWLGKKRVNRSSAIV